jgi:hypothetical protein
VQVREEKYGRYESDVDNEASHTKADLVKADSNNKGKKKETFLKNK